MICPLFVNFPYQELFLFSEDFRRQICANTFPADEIILLLFKKRFFICSFLFEAPGPRGLNQWSAWQGES